MSSFDFITYEIKDASALITFKRADCFNAMNRAMKKEVIKAIKLAGKDEHVRSLIITGDGKAFSSGQDLNDRTIDASDKAVDLGHTLRTEWNPLVEAIANSKKIVIGAINGVCAGAGLSVALSCDLLVARPKVKFVSGFAQIGLAPDAGSSHIMVKSLGRQKALEFFLMGSPLVSEDLLTAGLINHIDEDCLARAFSLASSINGLAPKSVELIKKNLQFALDNTLESTIERETFVQRFLGNSEDYKEGVSAFLEKRKPNFHGR
jgi:2-(1,2-epoxy-1,2-dihydrophenyl)acetyl-CoA isomerase